MQEKVTSTPGEDALNQLKAEVAALKSRETEIIYEIRSRETRQNDANIIKAKHNGYQRQSVYDDADIIYHAEGKAISVLRSELTALRGKLMPIQRRLGELTLEVNEKRATAKYEAHTVTSTQANIKMYRKSYTELHDKLEKVNVALVKLDKEADEHAERIERCEALKTKWLNLQSEVDKDYAAYQLDKKLENPHNYKARIGPLENAKADYEKLNGLIVELKELPNTISVKREELKNEASGIADKLKSITAEIHQNGSLIEQIKYNEKINEALKHLRNMIAHDELCGIGAKFRAGHMTFNHLLTQGITKPNGWGLSSPTEVMSNLLDGMDTLKAQIINELLSDSEL